MLDIKPTNKPIKEYFDELASFAHYGQTKGGILGACGGFVYGASTGLVKFRICVWFTRTWTMDDAINNCLA